MKRVPFSAIVADYRAHKFDEELATDWGSLVFYRLPAFVIAWALVPLGAKPSQLTFAGLIAVFFAALAAWFLPPATAMPVVVVLALAFNILDCADGPLARATGTSSLTGRYLDFAADLIYRAVLYASIGLIADRLHPGAAFPWLAVGLCCGFFATYARVNRLYAEKLFAGDAPSVPGPRSSFDIAFGLLSGLDTLLPIIALLAWISGGLPYALIWFLLYTLGDAVIEVAAVYSRTRRRDREQS